MGRQAAQVIGAICRAAQQHGTAAGAVHNPSLRLTWRKVITSGAAAKVGSQGASRPNEAAVT